MVETQELTLAQAVDAATRRIACSEHFAGASLVNLPLRYPSGASVVVQITEAAADLCVISDMGFAYQESDMVGATRQFEKIASEMASASSVLCNGRSFYLENIPRSKLPAAMVAVANCSQRAAATVFLRISDRQDDDVKQELFDRLRIIFAGESVEKDAPFAGASTHRWKVSVLVGDKSNGAIFEAVTPHYISVVGAAAKLGDIARLEEAPNRIAVVRKTALLGNYLGVLSPSTSSIIEMDAANDQFRRFLVKTG
ncbi:conserved hypothetical protein [Methylocella tundrae]|uniref:DUF1828 domain-containing protein n=1 Tax=Methylocella tundrae TaxID=227605 RepID=A0A8B6M639_METTU|nr:hypothetical protein [Methylocella tundrae]VTZ27191.1 conserved hypothetical protein [Methylocella tundrae]VTZ49813.1 conserved hypothetical protein [Methylocella tundrae]